MHALEQPIASDLLRGLAEQLLRGERSEQDAALLVMARDHVGGVLGEQPVALLAGAHRAFRAPMHELHHHRKRRGISHGAGGADQRKQHRRERQQVWRVRVGERRGDRKNGEAKPGDAGRPGDDAPVGGERGLDRHHHHPRNEPGGEAAGEPGAIGDEAGEIGRRGEMGRGELPVRARKTAMPIGDSSQRKAAAP